MAGNSWIIKSSGGIYGPYSFDEVYSSLKSREFSLMDEICLPCQRWAYIYDEPEFAHIVNEIRHMNLQKDDGTTQTATARSGTQNTISLTDVQDPGISDDLTEDITPGGDGSSTNPSFATKTNPGFKRPYDNSQVEDAFYQSFDDLNQDQNQKASETYVFEGDPTAVKSAAASTKWLWALTILVIGSTIAFISFKQFIAKPIAVQNAAEEQVRYGLEAYEIGDYETAIEFLNQANEISPSEKSILLPLALLELRMNGESIKATRLLDSLQGDQAESKVIANARGLVSLVDQSFDQAEESFEQALKWDSFYSAAIVNLGATALYQEDYPKAKSFLQTALKDNSRNGLVHLMLVESYFQLHKKNPDKKNIEAIISELDFHIQRSRSYYRQKMIAKMYALKLLGQEQRLMAMLPEFLDTSLSSADQFREDPMIYKGRINNAVYSQWCLRALSDIEPSAYVVSTEAVCLHLGDDLLGASRKIEDAIAQAPKDRLIHSVYASLLLSTNSLQKAKLAITKARQLDSNLKWQLPYITSAYLCADLECIEENWLQVLRIEKDSLEAHSQLAQQYFSRGLFGKANQHIDRALQINPDYIGALMLRKQLRQAQSI